MSKKNSSAEVYEQSYEVEKIVGDKEKDGIKYYHVKWIGYDDPDDLTWEPIEHLKNCRKSIEAYEKSKKLKAAEKRGNMAISDFYSCQKYPFAMIKIDQNDPLLPQFTAEPFGFRKYKKESDGHKKNFISIDNVEKINEEHVVINSETYQKPSVAIEYDIMGMMFPIVLNNWMKEKTTSKTNQAQSFKVKEEKTAPIVIEL